MNENPYSIEWTRVMIKFSEKTPVDVKYAFLISVFLTSSYPSDFHVHYMHKIGTHNDDRYDNTLNIFVFSCCSNVFVNFNVIM